MTSNYYQLIERIAKAAGVSVEDINRKVEAKRAKLSGLISREGAAQIIAAEMNINFEKQIMKVNELVSGMKKVNLTGKIIKMFPVKSYKKDTREGKIGSFMVADETGAVRSVLWDTNHIKLIEDNAIKEGDVVEIANGAVRNSEVHLTGFSDIKLSQKIIENVKTTIEGHEKKIADFKMGDSVKTRAFIVQAFEPKFFHVCPECNGKVIESAEGAICEKHGRIIPLKRALVSLVVDDGTGNIRAILFTENIEKIAKLEELDNFSNLKEKLMGDEMIFSGMIRQNKLFNNPELFVSDIEKPEIEKIIEQLEKARGLAC
jgi:ssDNA-binding replication factor A large subunit